MYECRGGHGWPRAATYDVHGRDCSDVHGCTNAAGAGMRRSGLQSLCHFLRLDNCSCIVLPSDFRVGRMEIRCASATEHKEVRERPLLALSSLRDPAALESQGLPSFVPLSCSTWKSRADRPRSARSPGKSSTGLFANLRLTHGKPAHRDESSPDFHLIPLRPWAPPFGPTFGHSNLFPTNLSLTLKQFTPPCSRKNPPA